MRGSKKLYTPKRHILTFDETIAKYKKQSHSHSPLRVIGYNKDVTIREEDRDGNFHLLGASGKGKSKFIEDQMRKDIALGVGCCLIDPSDNGKTFKSMLEYCASIDHKKVCIIDPDTLFSYGKIACIKALDSKTPTKSVQAVQDAINILFGSSKDHTPRIQENLQALFRMIAQESMSLYETSYFTEYEEQRELWQPILDKANSTDGRIIKGKFKSHAYWHKEFGTTITRLNIFRNPILSLIIGADTGIDFVKMIDEGWVILCNIYPYHISDQISDFIGILLISQLHRAIETLNYEKNFGDKGRRFYLYVDEAYKLATPQIERILSRNRKSGLHLYFAHHFLSQIKNPTVLDAVKQNTINKVMFHMTDDTERLSMIKTLGFGGQIDPKEAAHRYGNLPKRHFLVKIGTDYTVESTTPEVPNPVFNGRKDEVMERYIRERLEDPWYLPKYEIEEQIKSRINDTQTTNSIPSIERTVSDSKTNSDPPKTKRKSLLDLGREAEKFIRNDKTSK